MNAWRIVKKVQRPVFTQAVELYRGDFLAGMSLYDSETFEEWVLMQRETLRQQAFSGSTP